MPKISRKNTQIDNFKNVPRAPIYVAKHTYIHTHINIKKKCSGNTIPTLVLGVASSNNLPLLLACYFR